MNSWAETRNVNGRDALLRYEGFRIKERPRVGPNIWERRNGKGVWLAYTEEEAVALCTLRKEARAKKPWR